VELVSKNGYRLIDIKPASIKTANIINVPGNTLKPLIKRLAIVINNTIAIAKAKQKLQHQ
jgi:hypothetical protein